MGYIENEVWPNVLSSQSQPRCHAPLDDDSETDTMLSDERDNSAEYLRRKKFFTPRESLVSAHGSFRLTLLRLRVECML